MVAVADPEDAWLVELCRDGQWVAERVEPDQVVMRANCYRIGVVDASRDGVMCSPSLLDDARRRGFHQDGPLDFKSAFGDPENQADAYNLDRHAAFESAYASLPKLDVPDLLRFLREVYQGTPLFRARPDGSPFRTGIRTIARMNTEASLVLEPRRGLPPGVAHRMWCCLSTSLTGVYLPFHLGMQGVEPHFARASGDYDPTSAYWLFTELAKLADYGYPRCIDTITSTWRELEARTFAELPAVEGRAATLEPAEAGALLTEFDAGRAAEAIATLRWLLPKVKTQVFFEEF
jgi:dipeptidase